MRWATQSALSIASQGFASSEIAEAGSDNYGDFKFDKLPENSGAYAVKIEAEGHTGKSVDVTLEESVYLGELRL